MSQSSYPKGCRVRATADFREQFPQSRSQTGTVVGYGRDPAMIRVRRDGLATAEAYHVLFWERVPGEDPALNVGSFI